MPTMEMNVQSAWESNTSVPVGEKSPFTEYDTVQTNAGYTP